MLFIRILAIFGVLFLSTNIMFAAEEPEDLILLPVEPRIGSWSFSGMVTNESGERYGYFFQMHRQGANFHVKTALIDGLTNQLKFYYEDSATIETLTSLNWHVGHSFMRFNPINASWIFGVKQDKEGFNFKVDMLKQTNSHPETLVLRPGVELQALQTSRVNGHIKTDKESKEQFVTGNNAWFGKLWFSKEQKDSHDISTTFCRLDNDNGFYSANLKEADATGAAIAGWRDPAGNKVKMSQFISIKSQADSNQCSLSIGLPKLQLNVINTLKQEEHAPLSIAGFSKDNKGFCFVTEQTFKETEAVG